MGNNDRTTEVYEFIVSYKREHDGNSPTLRDIMRGVGATTPSVIGYHLKKLKRQGKIDLPDLGQPRGIEVVGGKWVPPSG